MFWLLWLVGSAVNALVVSVPLVFIDRGAAMWLDVRFLLVLATLHLWIGCDHSIPSKSLAHYRNIRVQHREHSWFPQLCGILILLNIWVVVIDRAVNSFIPVNHVMTFSGVGVAMTGLSLRWWAVRSLGSFFTEELKILTFQPLVRTGPYRWIRHPSYAAVAIILLGITLIQGSVWGLFYLVVVIVPMVLVRVMAEERMLRDGFGELYERYANRTDRLVPFIF